MKFHWYSLLWWFDMPMHFLGGLWLSLISIWIFPLKDLSLKSVFKIISIVFVVGVLWEVFEIVVNESIAQNPFDKLDTISDIAFDLAGGFTGVLYFSKNSLNEFKSRYDSTI